MDTRDFDIRSKEEIDALYESEQKHFVELSKEQHGILIGMNREQRRKYYKDHKKDFAGKSWGEVNNT